jgi:hypothetical protein
MKNMMFILLCCMAILFACSGSDKITVDKIPPLTPVLISHQGDLGDLEENNTMYWNDENNGIDAVPDGDWLRLSWEHLLDSDLDYIKIFRFDEFNPSPSLIDSIGSNNEYYIDSKAPLSTNRRYSYFIEVVDNAGNTAVSDTVSYSLLSKQIQTFPANEAFNDSTRITFGWQKSGNVSWFRLLLFRPLGDTGDEKEYFWSQDIQVTTEGDFFNVKTPNNLFQDYTDNLLYWRVDAFDWDSELQFNIGSESNERTLYLSSGKRH